MRARARALSPSAFEWSQKIRIPIRGKHYFLAPYVSKLVFPVLSFLQGFSFIDIKIFLKQMYIVMYKYSLQNDLKYSQLFPTLEVY